MQTAYEAAHTRAAWIDHSDRFGRFELTGHERLDLLHRMSTQDVNGIPVGQARPAVLTTALARIIDQLIIYNKVETVLAITGPERIRTVRMWLQKHIFFKDDVRTRDVSAELFQIDVVGPQAVTIAQRISEQVSVDRVPLPAICSQTVALIGPTEQRDAVVAALEALSLPSLAQPDYETLRIEAGVPLAGRELTEEYIPLEAGLWDAVSFSKGCYIGQEIIARMESRNKLARTLVGLHLPVLVDPGASLVADGRVQGNITSIAPAPDSGAIALGYLRTDALDKPITIMVGEQTILVAVTLIPDRTTT